MTIGNENDTNGVVEAVVACTGEVGRVRVKGKGNAYRASTSSSVGQQPLTGGRGQRRGNSDPIGTWGSQQPLIRGGVGSLTGTNDGNLGPGPNHHEENLQRDYYLSLGARPREYNGEIAATTGYELKNMDGVKLHSI